MAQDAVEDHQPDIAQNDTTDEVRHEEDRPENIRALDAARQRIGNREGQHVDDQQRHDRKERREPECVQEALILENRHVVFQADPGPLACRLELAERQENALQERVQKAHAECGKRRQQEQPEPMLDWAANQLGVQRCLITFSCSNLHQSLSFNLQKSLRPRHSAVRRRLKHF